MTPATVTNTMNGAHEHVKVKIPLPIHLACIMLLVAVTICYGPLASFFL